MARRECTQESPYVEGTGPSIHPSAQLITNERCDCCEKYECPICKLMFYVELPE